ncbi:MAG: IPT/TIG domain-containing protein [Myxococcales bacterium]|nr:IPT/TIG domain-containing protein [Myxococcales bacterium]MCB9734310.1 IPT/TIG domain-containing protein [Deltaproteobacteria bacterium]
MGLAGALAGCPDVPGSLRIDAGDAVDGDGGDTFVPLELERIVESAGSQMGGERVTIYGSGFTAGAKVTFGAAIGGNVLALDDGRLNVTVPPHGRGLVDVSVELMDGQSATLADAYLFKSDLAIGSVEPAIGPVAGGIPVTVRGDDFTEDTRVVVGDRLLENAERLDAQTIVGTLPARLSDKAGVVPVVVTDGFEQRVLDDAFRYVDHLEVDWLHPASGARAGGTRLTLYGRGLEDDTIVAIRGVSAEILEPGNGSAIVVRTPPGAPGPADVRVQNALDTVELADAFVYLDTSAPAGVNLVHAWPGSGSSLGGTSVALTVTGLPDDGVTVMFNDKAATVTETRPADNLVVVTAPPGVLGPVVVTVAAGGEESVRDDLFSYVPPFSVTGVEPASGKASGGETVKVTGTGIVADAAITFGGAAARVTKVTATYAEVTTPPGTSGLVDVVVTQGPDREVARGAFEYRASGGGKLWAITPSSGSQAGGRIVRLVGTGFRGTSPRVTFGQAPLEDFRVVDDGLVIGRLPRGEVGAVNVRDPSLGILAMGFTYFDPAQRYGGTAGGDIPEALNVSVLDITNGEGVDGAFVILWDDLGTPYQGVTDERGQITFSDVGFGPMQMVTASAENYTTASIVEFDARDATLLLIPLVSSPPGGGGGPGPTPLPDSTLVGKVTGLDKYVLPPPGSCDNRLAVDGGTMCAACTQDADCGSEQLACTNLGGTQGNRCTQACETDVDCPAGYGCRAVGGGSVQCLPSPGQRMARCSVTQEDVFSSPAGPAQLTNADGVYTLPSEPGEYAVVCLGGYQDEFGGFIPTIMGVRRHVFAYAGDVVAQQDVRLDIPLSTDLRIRLDDPPDEPKTARRTVDVFLDFGADGVFHMPSSGDAVGAEVFELEHFPVRFAESLYDATYTIYGTAVPDVPDEMQTGEGSFTLHDGIAEVAEDTVYELVADGVSTSETGLDIDVLAMDGPGDGRIWAVGEGGKVVAFDGTFWALQQAPTDATLRAVVARADDDVWAAGDGAVARWNGLRWVEVPMPTGFDAVSWTGMAAVGDDVWLWGDAGVWKHDGVSLTQVILDVPTGAVRDVVAVAPDDVWLVGDGGLLRHWTGGPTETYDVAGSDLLAVSATGPGDVWAVGADGRVIHWDGAVWFDYLTVTGRDLQAVQAVAPDRVWAVGDAGEVIRWDGVAWKEHAVVPHADLRAVWETSDGKAVAGGLHTLVIGPILRVPTPNNPNAFGNLNGLTLRWNLTPGPDASFTWLELMTGGGFPYWNIVADGKRSDVPLPDLQAAWGLQALWPGQGFFQVVRAYVPGFSMGAYDTTILTPYEWQSWVVTGWALTIPQP